MDSEQHKQSYETGKKVWESVLSQLAESSGFLGSMLGSLRQFIKRYFFSFLLFGIISGLIGAGIWYVKPKQFEAEMTVSYIHYEKKIYADMLAKLDRLVKSGSYGALSELLGLSEEELQNLKSIKTFNIRNEDLINDLSTEKVPFYIVVNIIDLSVLPSLQTAIVDYLNGTKFIQDRLNYMRIKSEAELAFLKKRLAVADSLSNMLILREARISDEKTISRMELLEETLTLFEKIQQVEGSLQFNNNIEVLDGFIADEKPSGKGMLFWIMYGFLAGFLARLIIIIFR